MSVAAITSSFVSAVGASASLAAAAPTQAPRAAHRGGHEGGRRHELVDAMNHALGIDGEQTRDQAQAVFRFADALMQDLRNIDRGVASGPGRGHGHGHGNAWGRRAWSDLPQRLDALATATATAAPGAALPEVPAQPLTPPVSITPQPATADELPPIVAVTAPPLELPPQPSPVTATSAAMHLMQVPSSRLIEAFAALRRALVDQSGPVAPQASRADLAETLVRLSHELTAGAPTALPAGSVLNLTA